MPWHVAKSGDCPESKPYAVIKDADGTVEGCHATEEAANDQMAALYANEGKQVKGDTLDGQLLTKAAAETTTDQGQFTAIAATYSLDRDGEQIRPGAFANTIKAWADRNRPIPLHWSHSGNPEDIIGSVDPLSMKETDDGLVVTGQLDLENSDRAKEAWRLIKADAVSLSFGFLGEVTPKAKDGTREIVNIDLYEISITPAPANPDTRFLSVKKVDRDHVKELEEELVAVKALLAETQAELEQAKKQAEETDEPASGPDVVDPLRKELDDLELAVSQERVGEIKPPQQVEDEPEEQSTVEELRKQFDDLMFDVLSEGVETT